MEKVKIIKRYDLIYYDVLNLDSGEEKTYIQGNKLNLELIENEIYEIVVFKNFINKAKLLTQKDNITKEELQELYSIIIQREQEVNLIDRKSLSSLFCNANNVASQILTSKEWDYDLFERISNEVYLTNLNKFLRINKR